MLKSFKRCKNGFLYYLKDKNSKKTFDEVIFAPFPETKQFKNADDYWEYDVKITKYIKKLFPNKTIVKTYSTINFCSCHFGKYGIWNELVKVLEIEQEE